MHGHLNIYYALWIHFFVTVIGTGSSNIYILVITKTRRYTEMHSSCRNEHVAIKYSQNWHNYNNFIVSALLHVSAVLAITKQLSLEVNWYSTCNDNYPLFTTISQFTLRLYKFKTRRKV